MNDQNSFSDKFMYDGMSCTSAFIKSGIEKEELVLRKNVIPVSHSRYREAGKLISSVSKFVNTVWNSSDNRSVGIYLEDFKKENSKHLDQKLINLFDDCIEHCSKEDLVTSGRKYVAHRKRIEVNYKEIKLDKREEYKGKINLKNSLNLRRLRLFYLLAITVNIVDLINFYEKIPRAVYKKEVKNTIEAMVLVSTCVLPERNFAKNFIERFIDSPN